MSEYEVSKLADRLWAIDDKHGCSMYLIEGSEKALLIDTGVGNSPLMPVLRELTQKPIELAITHLHIDHMYHSDEFETVYLHRDDKKAWYGPLGLNMIAGFGMFQVPKKSYSIKHFISMEETTVINLGDINIRVLHSPGHTPGSVTFVDEFHKALFPGDAVGSGSVAWLWMPCCYSVPKYQIALRELIKKLQPYQEYQFFGGHRMQGIPTEDNQHAYPLTMRVVEDMQVLCGKILSGELEGRNPTKQFVYTIVTYYYGHAGVVVRTTLKDRARKLKTDMPAIFLALHRKETPFYAKLLAGITIAYALSPIDLIPDFIPVLGYLDDILLLPFFISLTMKLIPPETLCECRKEAGTLWNNGKPKKWYFALPIIAIWLLLLLYLIKCLNIF